MKFSDEDKQVSDFTPGNYLGFGVHEVTIGQIEAGTTDADKEFVEFTVLGPNQEEDAARCWFVGGAANISFNTMRQIYVHCAPEDKKTEAGLAFDSVADSDEAVTLMQKCVGKKCWFTKYQDPTRTYVGKDGVTRKSVNKNVLGYEPKLREDLLPKDAQKDALNAMEGKPATGDAAANVPEDWA